MSLSAPQSPNRYYQDDTVFGESYATMTDVTSREQWDVHVGNARRGAAAAEAAAAGTLPVGPNAAAARAAADGTPPGGILTLVAFHVPWDKKCVKLLPAFSVSWSRAFPPTPKFVSLLYCLSTLAFFPAYTSML